jgi:hypothetical protein
MEVHTRRRQKGPPPRAGSDGEGEGVRVVARVGVSGVAQGEQHGRRGVGHVYGWYGTV